MPYIAQVALGKLPNLNVYGNDYDTPDGTGVRDYIHVLDLAEGHLAALSFLKRKLGLHVFNLGTGKGCSVLEMVKAFEDISGKSIPLKVAARRTGDVAVCYAEVERARHDLSWSATRTLREMCASTWNFQKNV
jgi:UDP-glucose 4-epimerase